jgi:7-cyano-7-deazaguanine reductase
MARTGFFNVIPPVVLRRPRRTATLVVGFRSRQIVHIGSLERMELTVLGNTVRHAIEHVEVFPAPDGISTVTFTNDELNSMCPVTEQPDLSTVVIDYEPGEWCVESKSLKLYLWGFRDRAVFAEALAVEIATEVMATAKPRRVTVTLTQRPRGGIEVRAVSELKR